MGAITNEEREAALSSQKSAGAGRIPLIATLIEGGKIDRDSAYKGLENLIEMTIVEVLTWTSGTFSLDVDKVTISDEYRYFPETLKQDMYLNTQSVLMDALRIYDEKMRDGTLTDEAFPGEEFLSIENSAADNAGSEISADDLGLGDMDNFEKKIPDVFLGLKEYDPAEIHRQKIREELRDIPMDDQERFFSFLVELSGTAKAAEDHATPGQTVILFSQDELIKHAVVTVCRHEGFFIFTTDEEVNIDHIVDQSLAKELVPILIVDAPKKHAEDFSPAKIAGLLEQKRAKYPQMSILQLVLPGDDEFSLQALSTGVRAIFPRPSKEYNKANFVSETIRFLGALRFYLHNSFSCQDQRLMQLFRDSIPELAHLRDPAEVSLVLLRFAAAMFERSITFIVGKAELIAERGIGIKAEKSAGATPPMRFKIPLDQPSVFRDAVENSNLFYGQSNDPILKKHLFQEIDAPQNPKILLLPIRSMGRVIAITYGDFGTKGGCPVRTDLLEILGRYAGLVLDNTLYRKKFTNQL